MELGSRYGQNFGMPKYLWNAFIILFFKYGPICFNQIVVFRILGYSMRNTDVGMDF